MRAAICRFLTIMACATCLHADVITILDSTDTFSFEHTGTGRLVTEVLPTACSVPEPTFGTCFLTSYGFGLAPVGFGSTVYWILEPNGTVSDKLTINFNLILFSYDIIFNSDVEGGASLGTPPLGANTIVENGERQLVTSVRWADNTTDDIRFISDVENVPEPNTAVLVASFVLIGLGGRYWMSKVSSHRRQT